MKFCVQLGTVLSKKYLNSGEDPYVHIGKFAVPVSKSYRWNFR